MDKTTKNVAVWICRGCDIGDSIDIDALTTVACEGCAEDMCHTHDYLCGEDGVEQIKQCVRDGAEAVVVAACSPRFNTDTFAIDGCLVERVNLREQVVWSHPAFANRHVVARNDAEVVCASLAKDDGAN